MKAPSSQAWIRRALVRERAMGPSISINGVSVDVFALSLVPLIGVVGAGLLYARACSILTSRGRTVGVGQRASYYVGLALIVLGTQTFIDPVGEASLLSLHMIQHVLIADFPIPFMLYGVRAPVVYFFWPKRVLVTFARWGWLRRIWRVIRQPRAAILIWLGVLYFWHIPYFYDLALTNRLAHDLEHITFILSGVLVWWPLLDPTHERVEGRIWKAAYVFTARIVGGIIGIVLIVSPVQIYTAYGDSASAYGVSWLTDQQLAGSIMMGVDALVVLVGVTYFLVTMDRGAEFVDNVPEAARLAARAEYEARNPSQ